MAAAFMQRAPVLLTTPRRPTATSSRRAPRSCVPPPRRRRRVRVKRRYTSKQADWEWRGRESAPDTERSGWRAFFTGDDNVIKIIETLWSKSLLGSVADSSILARVTALGARVLRSVGEALERTLYPDTEKELVVEYGLTEPSPNDKMYVDPLSDWQPSNVTYYRDSVGEKVYLQLDGATGFVAALDFRDQFDDSGEGEEIDAKGEATIENSQTESSPNFNVLRDQDASLEEEQKLLHVDLPDPSDQR